MPFFQASQFKDALSLVSHDLEQTLETYLSPQSIDNTRLLEAMRYSVLGGGKRIRPFLVVQSCALFNISKAQALIVAASLEMVHCYSLIHDDLPAMDDDALRRGKHTLHLQFDEATAILAGDALLTLAFEITASLTHIPPECICALIKNLARCAGAKGMIAGQMLDMEAENSVTSMTMNNINRIQSLKTGALIEFACLTGPILTKNTTQERQALLKYAQALGRLFQMTDDILDIEGQPEIMGKAVRKDAQHGKATFVDLLGLQEAHKQSFQLAQTAKDALTPFGDTAILLRQLVDFITTRKT